MNLVVMASGNGTDLQSIIDAIEEGYINARIIAVISDKKELMLLKGQKNTELLLTASPKKN